MYKPNFIELNKLTEQGYLRKVISPCKRLVLYNYTDKCVYEGKWNKHTLNSRGTVYEISTGKVVAKSFPKFFNYGELAVSKQRALLKEKVFDTYEKMDGSLGIVYFYDGEWRVNTRGSFTSDQAIKAKEMLASYEKNLSEKYTYLVEIIYPENRIIVNYGDEEKLTLLAIFDSEGQEYHQEIHNIFNEFPMPDVYKFTSIDELIVKREILPAQEEGFVVRFRNGERVKFKGVEYLKIAKILSGCSPLTFWKSMKDGKVDKGLLEQVPEEFRPELDVIVENLEEKYRNILFSVLENYDVVKERIKITGDLGIDRKMLGIYLKSHEVPHSGAMFSVLLNKPAALEKYVMKLIRPKANILVDK